MNKSIDVLRHRITAILHENDITAYLFGSVCYADFKAGWSDIDILVLTKHRMSEPEANQLVSLRQTLLEEYKGNQYFRLFEGGILSMDEFLNKKPERVVYWGTSGQRITDSYFFDVFSTMQLMDSGILIGGSDIRAQLQYPTYDEMRQAVNTYYQIIRKQAVKTNKSLYSIGWLFDIARCLYTLSERKIISKTKAGYWALEKNLVPDIEVMKRAIMIRENPSKYKDNLEVQNWLKTLGPIVQEFADVLESELSI